MNMPTAEVARAKAEIEDENRRSREANDTPERRAQGEENSRRSSLPSEHPDHICGMLCDGQDGWTSHCYRLRDKLFGKAK